MTTSIDSSKNIFGTADVVAEFPEREHVEMLDYKFGYNPVDDAEINIQGQAYALGCFQKFQWAKTVTVRFILPRRDEVTVHTFNREPDMDYIIMRVELIVTRAKAKTELITNTEACKYCGSRVTCPALQSKLLPLAKKYAQGTDNFEVALWDNLNPMAIDDPVMIAKMLEVSGVVENWGKEVRREALRMAHQEGEDIPGYSVLHRKPTAKFKGEEMEEVYNALSDFFTPEEFMSICKASLTDIAKAYAQKLPVGEKKEARPRIEAELLRNDLVPEDDDQLLIPYLRKQRNLT